MLQLSDKTKPFPMGQENAPVIIKWRYQKADEAEVPFTLNFWPNAEDGRTVVSVEFAREKEFDYRNVQVEIPCPSTEPPSVSSCDGDFKYDSRANVLIWTIESISEEASSGGLEFNVPEMDGDRFYPIVIRFDSPNTYAGISIDSVKNLDNDKDADYVANIKLVAEKFEITAE